jgi:TolA-binding protein
MLRSGELEGERDEEHAKGVPGPWKVRASSVRALRESQEDTQRKEHRDAEEAAETVALAPGEGLTGEAGAGDPGSDIGGTPSEAAELLSESVRGLVEKLEALRRELEQLEGRLEFSEIQEFSLKESLTRAKERADRERERADGLQAELDAERRDRRGGEQRGYWRSLFRG